MSDVGDFAVGIDLGTTNTVVSFVRDGQVELVPSEEGHHLHPSVVAYTPSGGRIVGMKARLRKLVDPENTVFSAKRLIGQPINDPRVQEAIQRLPYKVEAGENYEPMVVTRVGPESVIDISSYILQQVREAAERHIGRPVTHCVITVPAHFADGQRAGTRQAAERAGMQVLRILNEPTAAALAYGVGRRLNQRVAVFDMGGGTFDCTILAIHGNNFEVIATGGDPYLGGDDMDRAAADILARLFMEEHLVDNLKDRHARAKTLIAAEQIKMQLSSNDRVQGSISELDYGRGGIPLGLDFDIQRLELEREISPIIGRAIMLTERVLSDANLSPHMVDKVLLVGGATRTPLVRRRVREYFGKEPLSEVDPMLAVAMGAAIHAHALLEPEHHAGGSPLLMDVTGHGLGVATAGTYTDFLIERNTPIPVERTRVFSTSKDNQKLVDIKVCQGEAKLFKENHMLGVLHLEGLQPAPRGATRIEVQFVLDADGILGVTARDLRTGKAQQARLRVHGVGGDRLGDV